MRKYWLLPIIGLLVSVFAVAAVACDDDDGDDIDEPTQPIESPVSTEPEGETPSAVAEPIDITINPVGDAQVAGTATMDTDGTTTLVVVEISAGLEAGTMHQSHLHHGNCSDPTGEIHVNLESIEGQDDGTGMATTEDPVNGGETPPYEHWLDVEHYLAVHAADGTVIGCGDVAG